MDGYQVTLAQALGMAGLTFAAGLVYGWIAACLRGSRSVGGVKCEDSLGDRR